MAKHFAPTQSPHPSSSVQRPSASTAPAPSDRSDYALGLAGVVLAIGSTAFAAHMVANGDRKPEFNGIEHLAIFSRPSRPTRPTRPAIAQAKMHPLDAANIDYTPVGSISAKLAINPLVDYEVIDLSGNGAFIRMPKGNVLYVSLGDVVPGAGRVQTIQLRRGQWVVVTDRGEIAQKDPLSANGTP